MAELVASMVVGPLLSMVKEKASSYLLEKYKVMEGMEEQRKILERKLPAIMDIIEDAEEKGAFRPGVRAWLQELKNVAYEANDVFDDFKYEVLRREAKMKGHYKMLGMDVVSLYPSHNPILFRRRMGHRLRRIVQTIEVLVVEMNAFGFRHRHQALPTKQWRQTDSIMVDTEKDIVSRSRDEEKNKIVKILLNEASNGCLLVLPIVGVGGLGKTTFVKLIYNDPKIQRIFELKKWCCVSDDFDVGSIARSICNSTEKDREKALQGLQKELSGKKYLLVLDDVWNRDISKWEKLKTCLDHGGKGSAILTTTRDVKVAQIMTVGKVEAHNLQNLDKVFLKEIFEHRSFSLQKPNIAKLDDIVDKIVDRCAGSPLAAQALGAMLSTKTSKEEWKAVLRKSNICNEETGILPILKVSYDNLPLHMKQCFSFCAVFPKDYEIDVEMLIQLWMANDYIPPEDDVHLETIGKQIFNELAWRSFFQDVKQTTLTSWSDSGCTCKIHDLMHDIALSVLGKECVTITDRPDRKTLLSNCTRHLFSSYYQIGTHLADFMKKQTPTLQTLLYKFYTEGSIPRLSKYNSLRAIQLFEVKELPFRPRHLHHLRYLNLSGNRLIKELPEEISIMYNLQTLNLSHCRELCRLPKNMMYMASLRHLYTEGCDSLKCMPPHIGQLSSLQILTYFVVGASPGCSTVGELQNLDLSGTLVLSCLENVAEAQAKAAKLGDKDRLTQLCLEWRSECHEEAVPDCHKKVLDALKPHDGLEKLRVGNYKGNCLPTWMIHLSSLQQQLTELHLVGCTMCEEFPQFGRLKSLQILHLEKLDKFQSLCSDEASLTFLALKGLRLHSLKSMERWVTVEGRGGEKPTFPQLESLSIRGCPKLATLPEAPKLKVVELHEDKAQISLLIVGCKYMSLLSELELSVRDREATLLLDYENLESSLSELRLSGGDFLFVSSPSQPTIGVWKWFGSLVRLTINDCDALIYWPEEVFQSLVSLKDVEVSKCKKLIGPAQPKGEPTQTRSLVLPHLKSVYVSDCERLTQLFVLPPSLTQILISGCDNLKFIWEEDTESKSVHVEQQDTSTSLEYCPSTSAPKQSPSPTSHPLPCLEYLQIFYCGNLVTLPNLPPALKLLHILSCPDLCSVSGQLDALEGLYIITCSKLQSLDSLGHLPSLETLHIKSCKRLTSVPGVLGSYSALQELSIKYCPSINMKPLYERHQQCLDSLQERDLSHANSRHPSEGPKLKHPKTWKYAIPGRWRH